ncbi:hypothetical protein [Atribacter sp.]|uniref:hypothetical protein n=1 Tax=Atribacter sp. TaxID=2847780 RepID=UPI002D1FAE21|nr:hypothetical protein [Atribacter sp.]
MDNILVRKGNMGNSDNPRKGSDFEKRAKEFFMTEGIVLESGFSIPIGFSSVKKAHKFDLGSHEPPILVECKCHSLTESGNSPSAKLSVWNEAIFYFMAAPNNYRKILFVLKSIKDGKSLAEHYIKSNRHLIPNGVEIWEYSPETGTANRVNIIDAT